MGLVCMIEILEKLFIKAIDNVTSYKKSKYSEIIVLNIDILVENIDRNKSLVSATVTSLLKKIIDPKQDIRLHRTDFEGGYSARILDTNVTTPFFKKHFPKYANKESGFLSMVTRASIPWTLDNFERIRTRASQQLLNSFLTLFDAVEKDKISAKKSLIYLFEKLYVLTQHQNLIFDKSLETADNINIVNIKSILTMLERQFSMKMSSRLPVIAIYTIYQCLFKQIKRYKSKILLPLNVHTSSDKHGFGDVEIRNEDNQPFEVIEIKHNIPLDRNMLFDIVKKSSDSSIERYYLLTTAKNNFLSSEEEEYIEKFILRIKKDKNLEIIANGIFTSLKYYLRFIENYDEFILLYTKNMIDDSKISTEISEKHILEWEKILKEYKLGFDR